MDDLRELRRRLRPDALRRRVRVGEVGARGLQRQQFAEERVVLRVGDERSVENVIAVVVEAQLLAQLADAFGGVGHSA